MEISEISLSEFDGAFSGIYVSGSSAYTTGRFNLLNKSKAEDVKALVLFGSNGEPVAGQIFGLRNGLWRAPFSAPFSSITLAVECSVNANEFYREATSYLQGPIRLVWPAPIYPAPLPPDGEKIADDYNYHYPLERFGEYEKYLSRSGRYNHHRALKHSFDFFRTNDVGRAYHIIAENRQSMGYPLAMSLEQVLDTVKIIDADFFIMTLDGKDVAAAMLYHSAPGIVQVIYWGDLPSARYARAMNHLAWRVFGWYASNRPDIRIIDIGPASTDGVRNEGLCQFKLSIGCVETLRPNILIKNN